MIILFRGDKEGFWAVRGKRSVNIGEPMQSVDDMVEHDLSVLDEAEQMDLSQDEQLYYVAMKNLIQVIKTFSSCEGTKLQVSPYFHSRF